MQSPKQVADLASSACGTVVLAKTRFQNFSVTYSNDVADPEDHGHRREPFTLPIKCTLFVHRHISQVSHLNLGFAPLGQVRRICQGQTCPGFLLDLMP
jgi:hypothetical protein